MVTTGVTEAGSDGEWSGEGEWLLSVNCRGKTEKRKSYLTEKECIHQFGSLTADRLESDEVSEVEISDINGLSGLAGSELILTREKPRNNKPKNTKQKLRTGLYLACRKMAA